MKLFFKLVQSCRLFRFIPFRVDHNAGSLQASFKYLWRCAAVLLVLGIPQTLLAECYYSTAKLTLKITTTDSIFTAYRSISWCNYNTDSVASLPYWLRVLSVPETDSIPVYLDKITYSYTLEENTQTIDYMLNKHTIFTATIESIELLNVQQISSTEGISSTLTLNDTAWMKHPPIATKTGSYDVCFYSIFLHELNSTISPLLNALDELQENYNSNESNVEKQLLEQQFNTLLNQFARTPKIVVLEGCGD